MLSKTASPCKTVIQIANDDSEPFKATRSQIHNVTKAIPGIKIEVVIHSKGMAMTTKDSHWKKAMQQYHDHGISRLVCSHSMDAHQIRETDLLNFIKIIPSAVSHLVMRQHEGWFI